MLLCLDLEADDVDWQGPRGGLANFLGWMDPELDRLDSSNAQEERAEAIEQIEFGGGEACWVHLTWRVPKHSRTGEDGGSSSKSKKPLPPPELKLLFLDDTSRERFRRALAAGLNRTEESM
ncbi:hypothetical protein Emag_003870 [Eimeria magna]